MSRAAGQKSQNTPENLEKVKAMYDVGWSKAKIARDFGVDVRTIRRWLQTPDPEDSKESIAEIRTMHRERFVKEAWDNVFALNEIIKEKIKEGAGGFHNAKDAATTMGIFIDKINMLTIRSQKRPETPPISINILPPDGSSNRTLGNAIQFHGESETICCDDSGCGEWEDVRSLPPGGDDNS